MTILIKNGRVLNPSENMDKVMDVLIEDGLIKKKAENIQCDADKVIIVGEDSVSKELGTSVQILKGILKEFKELCDKDGDPIEIEIHG